LPDRTLTIPHAPMSVAWPAKAALSPRSDQPRDHQAAPLPRLREKAALIPMTGHGNGHEAEYSSTLLAILDKARFAPSGDNTQPWRFEIIDDHHLLIHGRDTRRDCVYDLRGHASQIALGALLETIAIAASAYQLTVRFLRRDDSREDQPLIDAFFAPDSSMKSVALVHEIEERVTQRRPLKTRALTTQQIAALEASLPPGYRIHWRSSLRDRLRIASLLFRSAHIRLTTREAYETHRKVIQWNAVTSEDRIPDRAVGVDPLTRRLMRWAMASWSRISFLNRFMMGTIAPRLQLDFVPGVRCASHFFLVADEPAQSVDDYIASGRALQRFWLTAAQQGLLVQPEMTPLIFTQYDREHIAFSESTRAIARASRVRADLESILSKEVCDRTLFMGRIGFGRVPVSRSLRLPLESLMVRG